MNWSPDEVEKLRTALLLHGRSWNKIQQAVGRSNIQCKMFYNDFASIEEYGLQQAIDERLRRKVNKLVIFRLKESLLNSVLFLATRETAKRHRGPVTRSQVA